jgi:hypothetical protein
MGVDRQKTDGVRTLGTNFKRRSTDFSKGISKIDHGRFCIAPFIKYQLAMVEPLKATPCDITIWLLQRIDSRKSPQDRLPH